MGKQVAARLKENNIFYKMIIIDTGFNQWLDIEKLSVCNDWLIFSQESELLSNEDSLCTLKTSYKKYLVKYNIIEVA